jgi:uncharacterized protein YjhX (UPF0386 family)
VKAGVRRNVRALLVMLFREWHRGLCHAQVSRGLEQRRESSGCVNMLHCLTRFSWQFNWARIKVGRTLRPRMTISTQSSEARRILQEAISASPVEYLRYLELDLALGAT